MSLHQRRYALGCALYWLIAMPMPARWWCTPKGWLWWAVPHIGYYAYDENGFFRSTETI